jgi:endonuclease/exonuclease/phosphatase family metal-dependent hydrolase
MRHSRLLRTLEAAAVLLFLVQSIRVLFSVLFGLIYDAIFDETLAFTTLGGVMLLAIAALLAPLGARRTGGERILLAASLVAALARIAVTINLPWVRLWSSIAVVAAAGLYAAQLVRRDRRALPTALLIAFAADQLLRVAGNTYDVSLRQWWLPVQVLISIATCVAAWLNSAPRTSTGSDQPEPGGDITLLASLGLGALLFLETSFLGFPNALSRWSGVPYHFVAPLLMAATLLPALQPLRRALHSVRRRRLGGAAVLLFAVAAVAAGRLAWPAVALAGMLAAQTVLLLVLLDCTAHPGNGASGRPLALGLISMLLLSFGLALTFTYAYVVPAFRDMGLPVLLVATALAALPAMRRPLAEASTSRSTPVYEWAGAGLALLAAVAFALPRRVDTWEGGPIRVGTYNIHYGYNTDWQISLEDQARTIEQAGVDVVVMQEVDACRITSYGVDDALWLARRLGMEEVYGPALEELSGIALLSRLPIAESDTRILASRLEQTAIVYARLLADGSPLHAYGVWLGLEPDERALQLEDALRFIGDVSPAVFGGDFNAAPDSATYARLREQGFEDAFVTGGFEPAPSSPAVEPRQRIDYVWVRGVQITDAQVVDSLASDHRMVVVEVVVP